jgi:hypothetical protein
MRGTRSRRIVWVVAGALTVTIASFLAIGLILEDSWPAQLLQGAGVAGAREPVVFPSDSIDTEPSIPTGQGLFSSPGAEDLAGGIMGTQVTFQGLWGGYCKVWGTDPAHPLGAKYYSGLLKMLVEGSSVQAYCIDLQYKIKTGDTYQANVYVSAEGRGVLVWKAGRLRPNPGYHRCCTRPVRQHTCLSGPGSGGSGAETRADRGPDRFCP